MKSPDSMEALPYQKLNPIVALYRKEPDKKRFMETMKEGGINVDGQNITPIDFFSTSEDLTDDEITEAIEGYLGIGSIEKSVEEISKALENSKDFIRGYLHVDLPREIQKLGGVKNETDVLKIFRKTATVKKGKAMGLAPAYCALISVAKAALEFEKKDLKGLIKESEYVYEGMFATADKGEDSIANFNKMHQKGDDYDIVAIFDEINNTMGTVSNSPN